MNFGSDFFWKIYDWIGRYTNELWFRFFFEWKIYEWIGTYTNELGFRFFFRIIHIHFIFKIGGLLWCSKKLVTGYNFSYTKSYEKLWSEANIEYFVTFLEFRKIEKTLVFIVSKTIFFLIIAVETLRSCVFWKTRGFHRFHGWGNVQLVFKQNRPLWERAFLGALCTCNGLVCSLQSHLCGFFSFYKNKKINKKTRNKRKKQQTASDPLPLGCAILFFCCFFCFFGFLVFCFLGSLLFWGTGKKSGRI